MIPFEADADAEPLQFVSVGTGDWIHYDKDTLDYKYVLVILLDTKYIMNTYSRHNLKDIEMMSDVIQESLKKYKTKYINS